MRNSRIAHRLAETYHQKMARKYQALLDQYGLSVGDVVSIPVGNIWIMHWSVNPIDLNTLEWLRENPSTEPIEGRIGDPSEEEFQISYKRLVDSETDGYDDDPTPIVNKSMPVNPQYPSMFIDNGTHRATVGYEQGVDSLQVRITGDG